MKREIRDRWVAALRSGDYRQGHRFLSRDDEFCCLGVLCEIAVTDGIVTREDLDYGHEAVIRYRGTRNITGSSSSLPVDVQDWAEVDGDPELTDSLEVNVASFFNDTLRSTFAEIADMIEESL